MYKVEDINIKKTISIEYGHNTAAVCYEIENGLDEAKLRIVPLFNYRAATDVSEKSDLKFDVKVEENTLTLVPHKDKEKERS